LIGIKTLFHIACRLAAFTQVVRPMPKKLLKLTVLGKVAFWLCAGYRAVVHLAQVAMTQCQSEIVVSTKIM
jgi:hypothetical protein